MADSSTGGCCISIDSLGSDRCGVPSTSTPIRLIVECASVCVGIVADKFRMSRTLWYFNIMSYFLHASRLIYYPAMAETRGRQ